MKIRYKKLVVAVFIISSFTIALGQQTFDNYYSFRDTGNISTRYANETSDGGFIVMGDLWINWPESDLLLMKTDSLGKILWAKALRNKYVDYFWIGCITEDSGYVMVGTSSF